MPGWTPSDTAVGTFTLRKKEQPDVVKAASPPKEKSTVKSESVSPPKEKAVERSEPVPKKETPSFVQHRNPGPLGRDSLFFSKTIYADCQTFFPQFWAIFVT